MMILKYDLFLEVFLVLVIKGHICNDVKFVILKSRKDLFKFLNPLDWVVE